MKHAKNKKKRESRKFERLLKKVDIFRKKIISKICSEVKIKLVL